MSSKSKKKSSQSGGKKGGARKGAKRPSRAAQRKKVSEFVALIRQRADSKDSRHR